MRQTENLEAWLESEIAQLKDAAENTSTHQEERLRADHWWAAYTTVLNHLQQGGECLKPAALAKALGIQLWTPVYQKGKGVGMKQTDDGSYIEVGEIRLLASRLPSEDSSGVKGLRERLLSDEVVDLVTARRYAGRKRGIVYQGVRDAVRADLEAALAAAQPQELNSLQVADASTET